MGETKKPTPDDLSRIGDKIDSLREQLRAATEEQKNAAIAFWGCRVGDLVRETRGKTPRTGVLNSVEYASRDSARSRPWINVRLNKKDGTPGERIVNFYGDWERVEDSATEAA